MKKIFAFFLALIMIFSFTSCRKKKQENNVTSGEAVLIHRENVEVESEPEISEPEPESAPQNELPEKGALSEEFAYLAGLKTEQVPWGPGTNFNADGKPTACVMLQEDYSSYSADFVRMGDEHKGKVYLTFDEGYENGYTGAILDVLKEKNVSAVFFVTLPYVKSEPELVKRMIDEGHIVGNHTANHPNMTSVSPEKGYDEVAELHNYVKENFGYDMYLFRFPEGAFSEQNLALLQKMGYRSVFWSFAYADWDPDNQMDTERAFAKVTGSLHDGEIFLLHAVSKTNTEILGSVIDYVRNEGFTFEKYTV